MDISSSMTQRDIYIQEDNTYYSRFEHIIESQIRFLAEDVLFKGWFIYAFNSQFQNIFQSQPGHDREQAKNEIARQLKRITPSGGTDIPFAILQMNQKIKEIVELYNNPQSNIKFKIDKLWIYFLTDNEDTYDNLKMNEAQLDSQKRDTFLASFDIKRYIRLWDMFNSDVELLKQSLNFGQNDGNFNDPEEEVETNTRYINLLRMNQTVDVERQRQEKKKLEALQQTQDTIEKNEQANKKHAEDAQKSQEELNKNKNEIEQFASGIKRDSSNISKEQQKSSTTDPTAVYEQYSKLGKNCSKTVQEVDQEEKRNQDAYKNIAQNKICQKNISKIMARKTKLRLQIQQVLKYIDQLSNEDKTVFEDVEKNLQAQLKAFKSEEKEVWDENQLKLTEISDNTKEIFLNAISNWFKIFNSFFEYCIKFRYAINKLNNKVNRDKSLLTSQWQAKSEEVSIYKYKLQNTKESLKELIKNTEEHKNQLKNFSEDQINKLDDFILKFDDQIDEKLDQITAEEDDKDKKRDFETLKQESRQLKQIIQAIKEQELDQQQERQQQAEEKKEQAD